MEFLCSIMLARSADMHCNEHLLSIGACAHMHIHVSSDFYFIFAFIRSFLQVNFFNKNPFCQKSLTKGSFLDNLPKTAISQLKT